MLLRDIDALLRTPHKPLAEGHLAHWHLTTAEILYHLPDHPGLLQSFLWQKLDHAPRFPELHRFLDFWQREIEGKLHSVRVASAALTQPAEFRYAGGVFTLH